MGICCCGIYDCFEEVFDILSIFWRFLILVVFQFFSRPGSNMSKNDFNRDVKRKKDIFNLFLFVFENQDRTCPIFYLLQDDSLSLYMYIYICINTHDINIYIYTYIHIYIYTYTYIQPRKLGFSVFFASTEVQAFLSRQEMLTWQSPSTLLRPHL